MLSIPADASTRAAGGVMRGAASPAPIVSVANFRDDRLYPKIECAVASILAKGKVVAPVDVLIVMGLLKADDLDAWGRGHIPHLERVIGCNLTPTMPNPNSPIRTGSWALRAILKQRLPRPRFHLPVPPSASPRPRQVRPATACREA